MSEAIPAATLVVMRDRADGPPELLAVQRGRGMAFAGGAWAFPGGRIDHGDRALAADELGSAKVAAIRETIEETGVAVGLDPLPSPDLAAALQRQLHEGEDFAALLGRNALTLDLATLTPFSRWRPAFAHARIFDTLFFLAEAPAGDWTPRPQPGECEAAEWIGASALLDRIERGEASAIFPTKRNLERLARHGSLAAALADAAAYPVDIITPWVEERDGIDQVCIPDGLGYPVTSEPLATAFRA